MGDAVGDGMSIAAEGFKPSELKLPYSEFKELADARREQLEPDWRCWLGDWELWDLACSPIPDKERRLIRYGHSLGWFADARYQVEG